MKYALAIILVGVLVALLVLALTATPNPSSATTVPLRIVTPPSVAMPAGNDCITLHCGPRSGGTNNRTEKVT